MGSNPTRGSLGKERTMEIKEAQLKLAELNIKINTLLKDFYAETGCIITDVDLEVLGIAEYGNKRIVPIYSVDVKVQL